MLTKSDLSQIKTIVQEGTQKIVQTETRQIVQEELEPVKKDIKYLKKKVNRIDKTVNIIAKNYDEGDVNLGRRVKKIEHHLGFAQV